MLHDILLATFPPAWPYTTTWIPLFWTTVVFLSFVVMDRIAPRRHR